MSSSKLRAEYESSAKLNDIRKLLLRLIPTLAMILNDAEIKYEELSIQGQAFEEYEIKRKKLLQLFQQVNDLMGKELMDFDKNISRYYFENMILRKFTAIYKEMITIWRERKTITKTMATFVTFLEHFSILPTKDIFESHFDIFIQYEEAKNGVTSKYYDNLCKTKAIYRLEKQSMEEITITDDIEMEIQKIHALVNELSKLEYYGKEILDAINGTKSEESICIQQSSSDIDLSSVQSKFNGQSTLEEYLFTLLPSMPNPSSLG